MQSKLECPPSRCRFVRHGLHSFEIELRKRPDEPGSPEPARPQNADHVPQRRQVSCSPPLRGANFCVLADVPSLRSYVPRQGAKTSRVGSVLFGSEMTLRSWPLAVVVASRVRPPPGITNSTWPSGYIQIPSGTATDQTPGPPHGCPHWGPPRSPPPSSASGLQSAGRLRGQADGQRVGTDCGKTGGMEPLTPNAGFSYLPQSQSVAPRVPGFNVLRRSIHCPLVSALPCLAAHSSPDSRAGPRAHTLRLAVGRWLRPGAWGPHTAMRLSFAEEVWHMVHGTGRPAKAWDDGVERWRPGLPWSSSSQRW